ncbi:MAG TPA: cyclopropane-fatty-acyl-phospholipid synthase family protein [Vicinamibacterales bacterium]|nr:cyclopropane-fatty-acyl-phospholipid synthase family protein [Vicinamibacterales bacterium]
MATSTLDFILDRGLAPDWVIRAGIRRIAGARLREQQRGGADGQAERFVALLGSLDHAPIATHTDQANSQHYELPPEFFAEVLGPHLKYSSAWWPEGVTTLADAEARMLALVAERADIRDGQDILELGCGWGSLTLYLAQRFPRCHIVGVSNSSGQRRFILAQAAARGLDNIEVITADINHFAIERRFDRIVSVEMLEHVRNYRALFARIGSWLVPDGRLFVHVFAHRVFAYPFESRGPSDWMARHFFTGGMMPSDDLFLHVQDTFAAEGHWRLSGRHYQRTAEAWLANFDRSAAIDGILAATYGREQAARWRVRWRVFFMACAEMFGYRDGSEWIVAHYQFKRNAA